jgi:hypothetical protein
MVATETGFCDVDGTPVRFEKGVTRVPRSNPLVKANPGYWRSVDENLTYGTEQATADPGEKRQRKSSK